MTPERWQRIDELLQETVRRPACERAAYLDQVCADEDARQEVESLLSFHEQAHTFLEVPAFEAAAGLLEDQTGTLAGLVVGRYKIERMLGSGGMGEVYIAVDTKLDRKVAIKFLPAYLESDELAKRRLIREARAAAKLDHPNICAIYEVGEEAGRSFIAMQHVHGETLASRIQRTPLDLATSLNVIEQVADALVEAHSHGIIHRDIKPQNIVITQRERVKVLDFGLAKVVRPAGLTQNDGRIQSALSAPGLIIGTAPYMSPEQAKGAPVDARSDLFSIGVVLYECLAGRRPFSGATPIEICSQIIQVDPPPPSHFNSNVPDALDTVTIKSLAKDPKLRYQSAAELLEDLRSVRFGPEPEAAGTTVPHTPIALSADEPTTRYAISRKTAFKVAIAMALVAIIALVAVPRMFRVRTSPPPQAALYWYTQGTAALRDGLYFKASIALQRALDSYEEFPLAHASLAEAMTELDYTEKASREILQAQSLVPNQSTLSPIEALYLKAITNTALREYKAAIESYLEIARRTQDLERAYAYVDLGRAYEKDDQINQSIESYLKAVELAPDDPAAFVRLGVLYGRKQELANAEEAFQKAQAIYQVLMNLEGVTEVLYQRGVLFNDLGKLSEARTQLEEARDLAVRIDNKHQLIRILLELSRAYYVDAGIARAERYATEAMELAQANSMESLYTQSLIALGYTFRFRRDYSEAERQFKKALDFAQEYKGRRNEASARLSLGSLRIGDRHDADGGLPYIKQAIEFYERGGYRKEISEALIQQARALSLKGNNDAALETYEQLLQIAGRIDDRSLIARAHHDIGNTLNQEERYSEAIPHLDESSTIQFSLNNQLRAGYSLADRGDALWRLGRYEDASVALKTAYSIADRPDDKSKPLLAKLSLIVASQALSERRFPEACANARQALTLNAAEPPEVDARYTLGLALAFSGRKETGKVMCQQAVEMARRMNDPQTLSNALLALATIMMEDRDAQALATALEATAEFARSRREESEWRGWLVAGRASQQAGDLANAREYLSRSRDSLAGLEVKWGTEFYNVYLTRPDVQYSRQQLRQALDVN